MAVYVVIALGNPAAVSGAVGVHYSANNIPLAQNAWLVADAGTTKDVSDKVGLSNGQNSTGVVFGVSGYFGYLSPSVWEWIRSKGS
jgi:hypothetical protein